MTSAALAERYRELGFRVIEGGKSEKLVILTTAAVAEIFDKEHRNVTRDLADYRKSISSNLSALFSEHCTPSTYTDSRGREQECHALTKVGFLAFAPKYDSSLGFLLALAFDALERDIESSELITQINERIRELRSKASGQSELDLTTARDRHAESVAEANDRAVHKATKKWSRYIEQDVKICGIGFKDWPIALRREWWRETDYNRIPASPLFIARVTAILKNHKPSDDQNKYGIAGGSGPMNYDDEDDGAYNAG